MASSPAEMPKASNVAVPKCAVKCWKPSASSNSIASRDCTGASTKSASTGESTSAGRCRAKFAASSPSSLAAPTAKSPEERFSDAKAQPLPTGLTPASTLSRSGASRSSSASVPGVTMRSTRRSTGPLAAAGSPICSQMATARPFSTSLAR